MVYTVGPMFLIANRQGCASCHGSNLRDCSRDISEGLQLVFQFFYLLWQENAQGVKRLRLLGVLGLSLLFTIEINCLTGGLSRSGKVTPKAAPQSLKANEIFHPPYPDCRARQQTKAQNGHQPSPQRAEATVHSNIIICCFSDGRRWNNLQRADHRRIFVRLRIDRNLRRRLSG